MDDVDEDIHKHNIEKFKSWQEEKELITFEVTSDITGKTIKVTLRGDFITCKDCRDKILNGWHWSQGSLNREKIRKGS